MRRCSVAWAHPSTDLGTECKRIVLGNRGAGAGHGRGLFAARPSLAPTRHASLRLVPEGSFIRHNYFDCAARNIADLESVANRFCRWRVNG
jgi:hypothetical protein